MRGKARGGSQWATKGGAGHGRLLRLAHGVPAPLRNAAKTGGDADRRPLAQRPTASRRTTRPRASVVGVYVQAARHGRQRQRVGRTRPNVRRARAPCTLLTAAQIESLQGRPQRRPACGGHLSCRPPPGPHPASARTSADWREGAGWSGRLARAGCVAAADGEGGKGLTAPGWTADQARVTSARGAQPGRAAREAGDWYGS